MEILDYIIGEGLVMIPVLYIIGEIIKDINTIRDNYIPLILLILSVIFTPVFLGGFTADNIVQAVLVTGATVYSNQVYKQLGSDE